LAETLFWGLLPWAILAATYMVSSPRRLFLPVAAIFWAILGFTQLGLTLWAVLLISLMVLVVHFRQALLPVLAMALGGAVALAGYGWFAPSSLDQPDLINPTEHFLYPFQLFSSMWGSGVSQAGWEDGLSLQVGVAGLGLAILAVFLWQRHNPDARPPVSRTDRRLLFFLIATLVFLLLVVGVVPVEWLWRGLIYPWQLLGFVTLFLAVLAGTVIWLESRFLQLPFLAVLVLVTIVPIYQHLSPLYISPTEITAPQAMLGTPQIALLGHSFSTTTDEYTAGMGYEQVTVPVEIHGTLAPGDVLQLHTTWHPLHALDKDYKIFVHLVDPTGTVVAQFDSQPGGGLNPTSQWIPGKTVKDEYPVVVPLSSPEGPYQVYLGLYDGDTLERLPVMGDDAGRVVLDVP
jgi:hypothetical protein